MALDFTSAAGNLFNRLGRIGKLADVGRTFQGTLATYFNQFMAQYDSSVASPLQIGIDGVPSFRDATVDAVAQYMTRLQGNATKTVLEMVKADNPAKAATIQSALQEVHDQMLAVSADFKACTVSVSSVALTTNASDDVLVTSKYRGDGRQQDLAFDEVGSVLCVSDSQTGGATVGRELWKYAGEASQVNPWALSYPQGGGGAATFASIDATADGSSTTTVGNILKNGDFEDFTVTNQADHWVYQTGVVTTDFQKSTSVFYDGLASLRFTGGAVADAVYQVIPLTTLSPSSSFAVEFRGRTGTTPATGILTVSLVDGSDVVINDDQGVANSFTVNLVSIGNTFASKSGVFRLPRMIPSEVRLKFKITTGLEAGKFFYLDHVGMGRMTQAYPGGPGMAMFSGKLAHSVVGDGYVVTTANNYGGSASLATWQWVMEKLFGIRRYGILFPTDPSPSVLDTLITAA